MFDGVNPLYDTVTSTEGDLNTHINSQAIVPNWAKYRPLGTTEDIPLPTVGQPVRSCLHARIQDPNNGKKYAECCIRNNLFYFKIISVFLTFSNHYVLWF